MRRHLERGAVIGLVLFGAIVLAQEEITVATLNQQQRQGAFQTASAIVPLDATGYVRMVVDINAADYVDPLNRITFRVYRLDASTGTWRLYRGSTWFGGTYVDPEFGLNPPPMMEFRLEELRGQTIRGEIDVPTRMRVGCTVILAPTPIL